MKQPQTTSIADQLTVLSEPLRLRLLALLEQHELTVGELASTVQLPQSTVSRHLKVLADAGWLERRSEGPASYYRFVLDDLSPAVRALWVAVRGPACEAPEAGEDAKRVKSVLADRKLDTQAFFGRVAGEWDAVRGQLFGTAFMPVALLSLMRPDWVVADVGCGTGNVSELVAPVVERVVAIDSSGPMLEAAKRRLEEHANIDFLSGAAGSLPVDAGSVDVVVMALVLHHIEDVAGAVGEARRVLRATRGGGMLLVIDMVAHGRSEYRRTMGHVHAGFGRETVEGLLRGAGFGGVTYRELPGESEARGPGLFVAVGRVGGRIEA